MEIAIKSEPLDREEWSPKQVQTDQVSMKPEPVEENENVKEDDWSPVSVKKEIEYRENVTATVLPVEYEPVGTSGIEVSIERDSDALRRRKQPLPVASPKKKSKINRKIKSEKAMQIAIQRGSCGEKFNRKSNAQNNIDSESSSPEQSVPNPIQERPFACTECDKRFKQRYQLKRHLSKHSGEKPFECHLCHKQFTELRHLENHMKRDSEIKQHKCTICGKGFRRIGELSSHMRIHTGEKPYKCSACDKSFQVSSSLTIHMRTHTGEKPFKCDVCSKLFNEGGHLKRHMKIHTGEKDFFCTMCDKRFNDKGNLGKHMRFHTGYKPYKCEVCYKRFIQNGDLKKHMRIHTGEKPFECTLCNKRFSVTAGLSSHMKTHSASQISENADMSENIYIPDIIIKTENSQIEENV